MVGTRADVCVYLMFYGLASNQSFRFPRCFPQRPNGNPMKARGKRYWKIRSRSEPPIRRWSEWGVVLYLERQRLKSMETLETADGWILPDRGIFIGWGIPGRNRHDTCRGSSVSVHPMPTPPRKIPPATPSTRAITSRWKSRTASTPSPLPNDIHCNVLLPLRCDPLQEAL